MYAIFFVLLENVQILLELLLSFFCTFKTLHIFQLVYYWSKSFVINLYYTTRKHAEFRWRFRWTSMSSDVCDGFPTNFRRKPKIWSRRNSVGHFRRNSEETWLVGIFRRNMARRNFLTKHSSSEFSDEFSTTFR